MKTFYYNNGTGYIEKYNRLSRWIQIYFNSKGDACFRFQNKRYNLSNFIRCGFIYSDNTIYSGTGKKQEKVVLSGYEMDVYYKPLFIELSDTGESVRIYRYEGNTND